MTPEQFKDAAKEVFAGMKGFVERAVAPLAERLSGLEKRIESLPDPQPGPKGDQGEKGEKGADAEPVNLDDVVAKVLPLIPEPQPGPKGDQGEKGESGTSVASVELHADGKRFDLVLSDGQRFEIELPAGVKGDRGEDGVGLKGDKGEDGEDGRDAPHVDVLDGINPLRRYQRGTWAKHRGGIVRSYRATEPIGESDSDLDRAGWHVVLCGISGVVMDASEDGRDWTLKMSLTDGQQFEQKVRVPAMIYRGIWADEHDYAKGDTVTRDGSTWVLQADVARGKPGDENSGWQLAVKKGRDGLKGEKGERGFRGADAKEPA